MTLHDTMLKIERELAASDARLADLSDQADRGVIDYAAYDTQRFDAWERSDALLRELLAEVRDEKIDETVVTIEAYDPGNGRADLDILVDGVSYSVIWDDNDEAPQIMGPYLSDVMEAFVKERLELFFTFYDNAQLKDEKERLTAEANGAMAAHLAQNEIGR